MPKCFEWIFASTVQAKVSTRSGVYFWGEWQKHTRHSPLLSNGEGLNNIGHGKSLRNLILDVRSVTVSHLIRYDSYITKYESCFIKKCDRSLAQNVSGFLLQNATVLLQIGSFFIICDSTT